MVKVGSIPTHTISSECTRDVEVHNPMISYTRGQEGKNYILKYDTGVGVE